MNKFHEMNKIHEDHQVNIDGIPNGGESVGIGIHVRWQAGLVENGQQNGAQVEDLIYIAMGRLMFYQDTPWSCQQNQHAVDRLKEALADLGAQQQGHRAREVENTFYL